ncbi:MAG TPA: glycosyltransferase family 2 protein [Nevskiaceae bacterium]|nr:glycosyltransferase family 2 protein [Nevskiaceae bacterium]
MKICLVIPFYRHENAIAATIAAVKPMRLPCILVDDGSGPDALHSLQALAAQEADWLTVLHLPTNQGKGAAVMAGMEAAARDGFTHALQIDADGQHDSTDIPNLIAAAKANPRAVVTGVPRYDESVPRSRLYGRYFTHLWVWINTLSLQIKDSMCGFRVYPVLPSLAVWRRMRWGRRMDFDTEILVRLFWIGVPVIGLPTRVTYPSDGVSNFDLVRDNLRIAWMHTRLFLGMLPRLPWLLGRRLVRRPA